MFKTICLVPGCASQFRKTAMYGKGGRAAASSQTFLLHPFQIEVKAFHLGSGPGCFSEKAQAGLDAGIAFKAVDVYLVCQIVPTLGFHHPGKYAFEGKAVQRVVFLGFHLGTCVYRVWFFRMRRCSQAASKRLGTQQSQATVW